VNVAGRTLKFLRVDFPMPYRSISPGQVAVLHVESPPESDGGFGPDIDLEVACAGPVWDTGPTLWHEGIRLPLSLKLKDARPIAADYPRKSQKHEQDGDSSDDDDAAYHMQPWIE